MSMSSCDSASHADKKTLCRAHIARLIKVASMRPARSPSTVTKAPKLRVQP